MKIISDIRVFTSTTKNEDGNPLPASVSNKTLNLAVHRIAMKLREKDFTLGEFDHLYINLTACEVPKGVALAKRSIDKYFPWYRYYDLNVDEQQLEAMLHEEKCIGIFHAVEKVLIMFFAVSEEDKQLEIVISAFIVPQFQLKK
ncbi:MAG: hypothetical protein RR413_12000 [Christensenellaceae bacterium]